MKSSFYKDDKLYIKFFQKIFFYAFNTIIKLFFTLVYIRIITLTLIFHNLLQWNTPSYDSLNLNLKILCREVENSKSKFLSQKTDVKCGYQIFLYTRNFNMNISHQLFDNKITLTQIQKMILYSKISFRRFWYAGCHRKKLQALYFCKTVYPH